MPAFSPDGNQLSWTSNRGAEQRSQIYLAEWDHNAALKALFYARDLVTTDSPPQYLKVDPPKNSGARGFRVFLGTIPDYSQGDIKGVKLSGVSANGPAAKAGVTGGDVIISLNGKDILNIYDFTAVLGDMKVGTETDITVERDGKKVELKIKPGSRD